jgi:hypothetical protein
MQKMVHYLQMIFALFGQNIISKRPTPSMQESHESCLNYALDILAERKTERLNQTSRRREGGPLRKLLACWFLLTMVDDEDLKQAELCSTWTNAFTLSKTR